MRRFLSVTHVLAPTPGLTPDAAPDGLGLRRLRGEEWHLLVQVVAPAPLLLWLSPKAGPAARRRARAATRMCNDYRSHVDLDTIGQDFSEIKIRIRFPEGAPNL